MTSGEAAYLLTMHDAMNEAAREVFLNERAYLAGYASGSRGPERARRFLKYLKRHAETKEQTPAEVMAKCAKSWKGK